MCAYELCALSTVANCIWSDTSFFGQMLLSYECVVRVFISYTLFMLEVVNRKFTRCHIQVF